jgi:hypothetical protein
MVIYFDAVQVLVRFVMDHSSPTSSLNIDVQVLSQSDPGMDTPMLPWKQLLLNERYFPAALWPRSSSVTDIIEFLQPDSVPKSKSTKKTAKSAPGITAETLVGLVMALDRFDLPDEFVEFSDAIDNILNQMGQINNCASPGSESYTRAIVSSLRSLKNIAMNATEDHVTAQINEVAK